MILKGTEINDKLHITISRSFVYFDVILGNDGGSCFKVRKEELREALK